MKHTTARALLLACATGAIGTLSTIGATSALAQSTTLPDIVTTLSGPTELHLGRSGQWLLSLTNSGWAAASETRTTIVLPQGTELDLRVSQRYPRGYRAVPTNCSYTAPTRTLVCLANNVAVGETRSFKIDLEVPTTPTNVQITASTAISAGAPDPNLANNSASANTLVASFTPSVNFPLVGARMWMCPGRRELLECTNGAPNWPLDLDANGQLVVSGIVRIAASSPQGSGTFVMNQYGTWGQLTYAWNLTPYNSRCFQGPVTPHATGDTFLYEGRVCY